MIFNKRQKARLCTRLALDRIKAESEAAHAEDSSACVMKIKEDTRQSLERICAMTEEEWVQLQDRLWEIKQSALQAFAQTHPDQLLCCRQPMDARGWMVWDFGVSHQACSVYAAVTEDILTLCNLYTEDFWKEWSSGFEIGHGGIVLDVQEITDDVALQGVELWLQKWQPALAHVPIVLLSGDSAAAMVRKRMERFSREI